MAYENTVKVDDDDKERILSDEEREKLLNEYTKDRDSFQKAKDNIDKAWKTLEDFNSACSGMRESCEENRRDCDNILGMTEYYLKKYERAKKVCDEWADKYFGNINEHTALYTKQKKFAIEEEKLGKIYSNKLRKYENALYKLDILSSGFAACLNLSDKELVEYKKFKEGNKDEKEKTRCF